MEDILYALKSYGTVVTSPEELPIYRGHEDMARNLVMHLRKARLKSFIIVGESGVGKTAILQTAFRELTSPEGGGWTVMETSTSQVLRETKYLGEWETRLARLAELATVDNRILLFFNDAHNLRSAGRSNSSESSMADALAPYIERGQIILIGECTPERFRRGIELSPTLSKLITTFQVAPADEEETTAMLRHTFEDLRAKCFADYGVTLELPETTMTGLVQLGDIYFPARAQPGAAIELLHKTVEIRCESFETSAVPPAPVAISYRDIVFTLHRLLGLPMELLDDEIPLNLAKARAYFDARVIGQSEAISTVVDVITLIKAGVTDPGKPTSVMLFAGPTGVGKTELAKTLATFLFGSEDRMIRCDMSEYKGFDAIDKLVGRPGGDLDPNLPGASLISRIRRQPFSVVLLDEIEKAHPNVFDVLLQAFDDARLTDPEGKTIDLTQTIIIMTSNLGSDLAQPGPVGFESVAPDSSETIGKALRDFFRPEFLNRIDHIVRFRPLDRGHIRTLAQRELGLALMRNGLLRRELRVDVDPDVYDLLALKGYHPLYGARPLRREVEKLAVLPVARRIVNLGTEGRGSLLRLSVMDGEIGVVVVRDRQTRTAQRIARGIEVIDPIDGGKVRVRAADVRRGLDLLEHKCQCLENRCAEEELADQKSALLERSGAIDFWDDPACARETLGEIYRLERLLEAVSKTGRRCEELANKYEILKQSRNQESLRQLVLDLRSAGHFAELVRFALECRNREDRRDALIVIRLVDEAAETDLVAKLADCYRQWAVRKGYAIRILHEETAGKNLTREVILEISGPAIYGILRGEEGGHEFLFGKTSRLPKRNRYVSVRVLGTPASVPDSGIKTRQKPVREPAHICPAIHSIASAADSISGKCIEIRSPLPPEEAAQAAADLLRAEIERRQRGSRGDADTLVRKYDMSPVAGIRDQRAAQLDIKPREFWKGEIDAILHAGIDARQRETT